MRVHFHKLFLSVALVALAACSGSGPSISPAPSTETGTSGGAPSSAIDMSGNVYEGDFATTNGQSGHMIVQLKFLDGAISGYGQLMVNGRDPIQGEISGNMHRVDKGDGFGGTFTINNVMTAEDFEFAFTGNPSGISGSVSSITNSPQKSASSEGSFSLTATGAVHP